MRHGESREIIGSMFFSPIGQSVYLESTIVDELMLERNSLATNLLAVEPLPPNTVYEKLR
jgi:hypothetical protein